MLLGGIVLISLCSVVACVFKYFILQDYVVQAAVECDPAAERCFVSVCDLENEECSGDPEQDTEYYKIIERSASGLPACSALDEDCKEITCEADQECFEVLCDELMADESGDMCSNPDDFKEIIGEESPEDSTFMDLEESSEFSE